MNLNEYAKQVHAANMKWWQNILPIAAEDADAGKALDLAYQGGRTELVPQPSAAKAHDDRVITVDGQSLHIVGDRLFDRSYQSLVNRNSDRRRY